MVKDGKMVIMNEGRRLSYREVERRKLDKNMERKIIILSFFVLP